MCSGLDVSECLLLKSDLLIHAALLHESPDGKIYISCPGSKQTMSIIHNPDAKRKRLQIATIRSVASVFLEHQCHAHAPLLPSRSLSGQPLRHILFYKIAAPYRAYRWKWKYGPTPRRAM